MTYVSEIIADFETLRSAAFGSVGASYTAMGNALSNPASALIIVSGLDEDVLLSIDGSTDQIGIPAGLTTNIDFGSNRQGTGKLYLPKGTIIYQKQGAAGAPSSGTLYVTVMYAR